MNGGDDYRARLVARLRELLDSCGVSVSAVEKRLDHGRGYVGDALRGQKKLSVETILEVLRAVGVTPEEFFERPIRREAERDSVMSEPRDRDIERRRSPFPGNPSPVVQAVALLLADKGLGHEDLRDVQRALSAAVQRTRAPK